MQGQWMGGVANMDIVRKEHNIRKTTRVFQVYKEIRQTLLSGVTRKEEGYILRRVLGEWIKRKGIRRKATDACRRNMKRERRNEQDRMEGERDQL